MGDGTAVEPPVLGSDWEIWESITYNTPGVIVFDSGAIAPRVRIHNQNMTTAAKAQADRETLGHLS